MKFSPSTADFERQAAADVTARHQNFDDRDLAAARPFVCSEWLAGLSAYNQLRVSYLLYRTRICICTPSASTDSHHCLELTSLGAIAQNHLSSNRPPKSKSRLHKSTHPNSITLTFTCPTKPSPLCRLQRQYSPPTSEMRSKTDGAHKQPVSPVIPFFPLAPASYVFFHQ